MPTITRYLAVGADDWYWLEQVNSPTQQFDATGSEMHAGGLNSVGGNDQITGFGVRIPDLGIPQGADIVSANLSVKNNFSGHDDPSLYVRLYDADSAISPTTYSEANGATLTTDRESVTPSQTTDPAVFSFLDPLQEVVNRAGFTEQSAIVVDVRPQAALGSGAVGNFKMDLGTLEGGYFASVTIEYNTAPAIEGAFVDYGPLGRVGSGAPGVVSFRLTDEDETATDALNWQINTSANGQGTVVTSGTTTTGVIETVLLEYSTTGIVPGTNILYLRVDDGTRYNEVAFTLLVQQAGVQSSGLVRAVSRGYEVLLRNMRSGQIVQWLPEFKSLSYKRSARGIGEWTLQLSHTQIDGSLLSSGTMVEIHREGWLEMAGPIVQPFDYDDANDRLTVTGRDMKYLLLARLTSLVEADAVDGVSGETAMRHYVGTWAIPQWNEWFGNYGAEMALQAVDQQRGGIVAHSAVGQTVLSICSTLAIRSGLWFDVVFDERLSAYRFEVYEITDAGEGTVFPWTFSTKLENVENMRYSRTETPTIMYGLGPVDQITGVRTVETATRTSLEDAVPSIPREAFVDLRYAGGSALPSQTLANLLEETERAEQVVVTPNHRSIAQYREPQGWDLGYRVGADIHRIGQYTERLVQEVQVTISGDGPEKMEITLGDPTVDLLDLLDMYFARTVAAQTG